MMFHELFNKKDKIEIRPDDCGYGNYVFSSENAHEIGTVSYHRENNYECSVASIMTTIQKGKVRQKKVNSNLNPSANREATSIYFWKECPENNASDFFALDFIQHKGTVYINTRDCSIYEIFELFGSIDVHDSLNSCEFCKNLKRRDVYFCPIVEKTSNTKNIIQGLCGNFEGIIPC